MQTVRTIRNLRDNGTAALTWVQRLPVALCVTVLLGAALSAAPGWLAAEDNQRWVEVELQDGTKVTAPLVRSSRQTVTVVENGAERQIDMATVKVVNYLDAPPAAVAAPAPAPVAPPAPTPPTTDTPPTVDPVPPTVDTPPVTETPPLVETPPTADTPPPTVETPPLPPVAPANPDAAVASIEVPLPAVEAGKTEMVKLVLQWTKNGAAPWYKVNRGSSLHQMPEWTRATPIHEKDILAAIDQLPDTDARKKLSGNPTEAAPYLVIYLLDSNPAKAQACAQLLIERGNRDVTKYLIEALYATTDPDDKAIAAWLQPYARTLLDGCKKFTGVTSAADPAKPPFSAAEFVEDWKANLTDAVPQLGEPAYKPETAPNNAEVQKVAWITFFRTLSLKRATFVEPAEEKVDLTRKYAHAKDASEDKAILADLAQLASDKEKDRGEAKARLQSRNWAVVAPYLAKTLLESNNVPVRLVILDLINSKGDKGFTWHVLMTLKDSWGVPTAVPGPNNAALIRISDNLLRSLSGFSSQPAVQPTFVGGYKPIQGYIDYWNEHYKEFPVQYGEPELDKTRPKYNEYLKELRFIKTGDAAK